MEEAVGSTSSQGGTPVHQIYTQTTRHNRMTSATHKNHKVVSTTCERKRERREREKRERKREREGIVGYRLFDSYSTLHVGFLDRPCIDGSIFRTASIRGYTHTYPHSGLPVFSVYAPYYPVYAHSPSLGSVLTRSFFLPSLVLSRVRRARRSLSYPTLRRYFGPLAPKYMYNPSHPRIRIISPTPNSFVVFVALGRVASRFCSQSGFSAFSISVVFLLHLFEGVLTLDNPIFVFFSFLLWILSTVFLVGFFCFCGFSSHVCVCAPRVCVRACVRVCPLQERCMSVSFSCVFLHRFAVFVLALVVSCACFARNRTNPYPLLAMATSTTQHTYIAPPHPNIPPLPMFYVPCSMSMSPSFIQFQLHIQSLKESRIHPYQNAPLGLYRNRSSECCPLLYIYIRAYIERIPLEVLQNCLYARV